VQNADGTTAASLSNPRTLSTPSVWQKFTLSFTPTGSTVLISVGQFGPQSTVEEYFDNVQLLVSTNTPSPTPPGTLTYTPTPSQTPVQTYTPTPTASATSTSSPTSTPSPLNQAKYTYDGDGNLVKSNVTAQNGTETITYYVSGYYNVQVIGSNTTVQKFYTFGSQTIAIQTSLNNAQGMLNWIMSDNLNSTTVTANADGTFNFGEEIMPYADLCQIVQQATGRTGIRAQDQPHRPAKQYNLFPDSSLTYSLDQDSGQANINTQYFSQRIT
jgi:hypothetical protein